MLRYPTVSDSQIAFVYANNIWVVPRTGGVASPLAAPPGASALPHFSPDGHTIAFVGNYDGNRDIYTIPVAGGIPLRVTHHPGAEALAGWANADTLLYFTAGAVNMARQTQMYTVPATGGLPTKLPVPYGAFGSISADGQYLAYTPHSIDNRTWKRYRGGMATDVWVVNLKDHTSKKVTDWEGADTLPMWGHGSASKTIFYLSDGGDEHRLNIWSCSMDGSDRKQITKFADDDVRWPSMGPGGAENKDSRGEIVFQLGSKLMLLNLDTGESRNVDVVIPGAHPKIRPHAADASETISSWGLSPSGKRALFVGRGDIWSVPVKEGVTRNLSHTGGVFERDASWSPDGKWIAYFSDQSGEYELWIRPSDAKQGVADDDKKDDKADDKKDEKKDEKKEEKKDGDDGDQKGGASPGPTLKEPVKLTSMGPGFRYNPTWSPDSKRIAFTDKAGKLLLATLSWEGNNPTAEVKEIDKDPEGEPSLSWSSDSGWIAYTRADESSEHNCIWMFKVASGEKTRVTSPMFCAAAPTFDRKGDFLYYRAFNKFTSPRYADGDSSFIYAGTQQIMMAPLRDDVKNPLALRNDEEDLKKDASKSADKKDAEKKDTDKKDADKGEADKKDGEKKDDADTPAGDKKPDSAKKAAHPKKDVKIDLDGFENRATALPIASGDFGLARRGERATASYLLYVHAHAARGDDEKPAIKIFDPKAYGSGRQEG